MKLYCSQEIYFNTEDGYYYIVNDLSHTPYITEEEAISNKQFKFESFVTGAKVLSQKRYIILKGVFEMTQNKTITIFDKTFNAVNICTINYSGDKLVAQRRLGMNVVYPSDDAKKYIAQVYGKAGSIDTEFIIVNRKTFEVFD